MPPRVLVVDDHPMIRQGLRRLLGRNGLDVVGEAKNGAEAQRLAHELRADIVVLGFTRPLSNCLSVAGAILQAAPGVGVILIAFEDYFMARAFEAGIKGYVLKTKVVEELPHAVRAVAGGNHYVSPDISAVLADTPRTAIRQKPSQP